MQLQRFKKIYEVNDSTVKSVEDNHVASRAKYYVQEKVWGAPVSIYVDAKENIFKVGTRQEFLKQDAIYYEWQNIIPLYRTVLIAVSKDLGCPIVCYGQIIGGRYGSEMSGRPLQYQIQYSALLDLIIHDIKVPQGFLGYETLKRIQERFKVPFCPVIFKGTFEEAINFPANLPTAVPFTYNLPTIEGNKMRGIVIRPIVDLSIKGHRVILKKINPTYANYKNLPVIQHNKAYDAGVKEISNDMEKMCLTNNRLNLILSTTDIVDYNDLDKVAGKYVEHCLGQVSYLKYNMLSKIAQKLVNKELNRRALIKVQSVLLPEKVA